MLFASRSLDTHNAACGIETDLYNFPVFYVKGLDTHNAACGIETFLWFDSHMQSRSLDTHNAACGIETKLAVPELPTPHESRHTQCCVRH